ncbi:hypothetical protein [Frisingicoccus sp.]|uniref:hypothetical protein n=1 Tax=Frisingicoccus sp. TaxID=1918627 RepID=UPI002A829BCC|nr:hypothetical protein [Frisingicoccus sp.]MDY4922760.1 hypothetical protein [Frisingicoccus sp.]
MEIAIVIDELTECLVETATGKVVETYYERRVTPIKIKDFKGWKFKWNTTEKNGYDIYELYVQGSDIVQGRISFRIDGGVADVDIAETAPHNFGHTGQYTGVGGHLFAIACKVSMDAGCDGFVAFTAKNKLIEHYKETLGAKVLSGQRMYIDETAAQVLIAKYLEG